ncbi:hypothetical protein DZA35_00930 [Arcobacter sp. HD9-500m-PIT-SAG03]|nr:hypothetical protein DZA35_00930 [Arcobacter sp. HD9-500m-PIT-SAG03]
MTVTNQEYRKYYIPTEKKSYNGMDALLHLGVGKVYKQTVVLKHLYKVAKKIYEDAKKNIYLSDKDLNDLIINYRRLFMLGKIKDDDVYDAIACICEVCFREFGYKPYYVQIMGVLGQYYNFAIQMLPGEGKTITATISGIIAAWKGKPCHIVTSNDYLASRDAKIMSSLYERCLLSVGSITGSMQESDRRENYKKSVVYSTSKELLADFLRDQLVDDEVNSFDNALFDKLSNNGNSTKQRVMRGLYTAIVDEADSVLSDEALTPLVISAQGDNEILMEAICSVYEFLDMFQKDTHYKVLVKFKEVKLTSEGDILLDKLDKKFPVIWRTHERKVFLLIQSLLAKEIYLNGKDYIVDSEGKIVLVDEKTGRLMPGKSWGAGLQQAVEAKEKLELTSPTQTNIKMSFQRFFRFYTNLSGMSGTLQNIENELWSIYELPVIYIPKRIKNTYDLKPISISGTLNNKLESLVQEIIDVNKLRRPILVGTTSINESERLAVILEDKGIKCTVLNAKHHNEEDEIISIAGQEGSITISTNIAGRGTDIKIDDEIEKLGGLHVIATQLAESKRVDLQLYGRTSRQGQVGSVKVFLSLEDELMEKNYNNNFLNFLKKRIHTRLMKYCAILLYKYAQIKQEKKSSKIRLEMLQKDFDFAKRISFVK